VRPPKYMDWSAAATGAAFVVLVAAGIVYGWLHVGHANWYFVLATAVAVAIMIGVVRELIVKPWRDGRRH
jgi:hypothetical protein